MQKQIHIDSQWFIFYLLKNYFKIKLENNIKGARPLNIMNFY